MSVSARVRAIRRYAGHRYEQPSTDANGSGGGCNLFTVWHSSGLCSWAPSKLVLIPNHGYGQLGIPWYIPWAALGLIVLLVAFSAALAVRGPSQRIRRMSIVETIHAE